MKWNDNYLHYSGENKSIIYNYLLFLTQKLKKIYDPETLTPIFIINYIFND
jgi:hypothetical protein